MKYTKIHWFTENNPDECCAWNMLGILKERMSLKSGASKAFRNALRLSDRTCRDKINMNYGRSLINLNNYPEAIVIYKDVQEATFNSEIGLALALFKGIIFKNYFIVVKFKICLIKEQTTLILYFYI